MERAQEFDRLSSEVSTSCDTSSSRSDSVASRVSVRSNEENNSVSDPNKSDEGERKNQDELNVPDQSDLTKLQR